MSEVQVSPAPRFQLNFLRLAAALLYIVTGIISLFNPLLRSLGEYFSYLSYANSSFVLAEYHLLFVSISLPIACLALAITGVLARTGKIWVWGAGAYFLLTVPMSWLMTVLWETQSGYPVDISHWQLLWTGNDFMDTGITITLILATILAAVSMFVKSSFNSSADNAAQPQVTQAPSAPVTGSSGQLSNLPMFALIGAFVIPIAGIILGHMSISQMNRGMISNQNRGMAMAGLILGYVFIALSIIFGILLTVALIATRPTYYY